MSDREIPGARSSAGALPGRSTKRGTVPGRSTKREVSSLEPKENAGSRELVDCASVDARFLSVLSDSFGADAYASERGFTPRGLPRDKSWESPEAKENDGQLQGSEKSSLRAWHLPGDRLNAGISREIVRFRRRSIPVSLEELARRRRNAGRLREVSREWLSESGDPGKLRASGFPTGFLSVEDAAACPPFGRIDE